MCRNAAVLDKDSVYTQTTVEADGSFGGCPDGERACSKYGPSPGPSVMHRSMTHQSLPDLEILPAFSINLP